MTAPARLAPGDTAPEFELPTSDGATLSSHDLRGHRVLLWFYPAAMTPGCTKQACGFRDSWSQFTDAGFTVVGISPDKPAKLAKFAETENLPMTLLSDVDKTVMPRFGAFGEKQLYGRTVTGVIRSTLLLSPDWTLEQAWYAVKATGHVERLRSQLLEN